MRIAIVDDFAPDRARLAAYVERCAAESGVAHTTLCFSDGESFLQAFAAQRCDLVLLDIYMDGIDGLETARRLRQMDPHCLVLFTTTSREHAVESYEVNAAHYLLKPFDYERFAAVFAKCMKRLRQQRSVLTVISKRKEQSVPLRDIVLLRTAARTNELVTAAGVLTTYQKYSDLAGALLENNNFIECIRGCVINLDCVAAVDEDIFILKNGMRLPIRRRNRAQIKAAYARHLFSKLWKEDSL